MAYVATNPPQLMVPGLSGGVALWGYSSDNVHTDVDAADFFTNGAELGLKVNDVMIVSKTTATVGATLHTVMTVTAGGAATISPAILA